MLPSVIINSHPLGPRKVKASLTQMLSLRHENQRLHTIPSPLNNCEKYSRWVKENPQRILFLWTVQDLGLSTEGSLAALRARHERWCNVWNAEIDSINPRTIGHLLRDVADWDQERGRIKEAPKIEDTDSYVVRESKPCVLYFSTPTRRRTRPNLKN